MGKTNRKKKRTHLKKDEEGPHTFVINKGPVRKVGIQLMLDIRKVMEPYTASNVKARKRNKLKDYIHISGQFGVTHLLVLSRSLLGYINIRICKVNSSIIPHTIQHTVHHTQLNIHSLPYINVYKIHLTLLLLLKSQSANLVLKIAITT